jgi:hypothetical protein
MIGHRSQVFNGASLHSVRQPAGSFRLWNAKKVLALVCREIYDIKMPVEEEK